jgi:hypothetical protein
MDQLLLWLGVGIDYSRFIQCPNHDDDRPSLKVYEGYKGWYCFECNSGGGPVEFLAAYKEIPFNEAAKLILNRFGIDRSAKNFKPEMPEYPIDFDFILNAWEKKVCIRALSIIRPLNDKQKEFAYDEWLLYLHTIVAIAKEQAKAQRSLRKLRKVSRFVLQKLQNYVKMINEVESIHRRNRCG